MIELHPKKFYRIMYIDGSEIDFQAVHVPVAKHLIEVRTKHKDRTTLFELLTDKRWIDIFEISEKVAKL